MKLPEPIRPLYVWGGYVVLALVLAAATGGAEWVKSAMAIYLVWAIVETIRFIRHRRRVKVIQPRTHSEPLLERTGEQAEQAFAEFFQGETIWTGAKKVRFNYRNSQGEYLDREVTVHKVVAVEGDTYFVGFCHIRNEPRTFRLDRVFPSNRVIDGATGEINTLRKILGVKRQARD
ncbi:WYL domain-containing protein [Pseudomonas aeruginosa]